MILMVFSNLNNSIILCLWGDSNGESALEEGEVALERLPDIVGITQGIVIRPGDMTYPGNLLEEPDGCRESLSMCECDT